MADIAFLLLVFFLVTTNINQDFAINTNISKPFEKLDSMTINQSILLVNADGRYMLNDVYIDADALHTKILESFDDTKSVKNVLLIKSDREVSYTDFIKTLDNSKKAFKQYYNLLSQAQYNRDFHSLSDTLQLQLQTQHPVALAEDVLGEQ